MFIKIGLKSGHDNTECKDTNTSPMLLKTIKYKCICVWDPTTMCRNAVCIILGLIVNYIQDQYCKEVFQQQSRTYTIL